MWVSDDYAGTSSDVCITNNRITVLTTSEILDSKYHNMVDEDTKGWAKRICYFQSIYIPRVMNPDVEFVQWWNKYFAISCFFAVFLDPLFFFLQSVQKDNKCVVLDWPLAITILVLRSVTDFIYLIRILLQFRLAYASSKSRTIGAGDLVDDPRSITQHYLYGYFIMDLFCVLPIPQISVLLILSHSLGETRSSVVKNSFYFPIIIQYCPRVYRFLCLLADQPSTGFIFESVWTKLFLNPLIYVWASHVVGSYWYLFGLQRVYKCLQYACQISNTKCVELIQCRHGNDFWHLKPDQTRELWKRSEDAGTCFVQGKFDYGIYQRAVILTTHQNVVTRYLYSLNWGLQQISSMAGNQVPNYFVWEVIFIGMGILFFSLLIGNVQNIFQAPRNRRLDMLLRCQEVEQWMSHRHLPEDLRMKIRRAERFNWESSLGVNEEMLMKDLPEDLRREIRHHVFRVFRKVRIFQLLEEPIIDAICERLRTNRYIRGSKILIRGGLVDKLVFVIRGRMESIEDLSVVHLSEGDVCGQELLAWCLKHSSVNDDRRRIGISIHRLVSNRLVHCLTNVEAFILRATDIEEVASHFPKFFKSPLVQGAIRYESPYYRILAARRIQDVWRYRKKKLCGRASSLPSPPCLFFPPLETGMIPSGEDPKNGEG